MTAAAVFRVGMHTFLGWGSVPITDRNAIVDEMPETQQGEDSTPWYLVAPPVFCLAAAVLIAALPGVREQVLPAANRLWFQPAYLHVVYTGTMSPLSLPSDIDLGATSAGTRGIIAAVLGGALALTSVFRFRLKRTWRLGSFLEGPLKALRSLQSGQIGDYVLWMTIGISTIGMAYITLLR